jgi:hypothetical protein
MRRRDDLELATVFFRKLAAAGAELTETDWDAARRELYEMGVRDGVGKRRRKSRAPGITPSDYQQDNIKRTMPFIRRIARAKHLDPSSLVNGTDLFTARQRHEAFFVLREVPGRPFSFPVIAAAFGKDHATVIDGCRKVEQRIAADAELGVRLRGLARRVGAAA